MKGTAEVMIGGDELDANQAYEKTNDEDDERDGR